MPRPRLPFPAYKKHPRDNSARCWHNGRWVVLGPWNSPESHAAYARIVAEIKAGVGHGSASSQSQSGPGSRTATRTVNEVALAFIKFADIHYRTPTGEQTNSVLEFRYCLKPVRELYGHTPADEFGPIALQTVRNEMIRLGWCRTSINRRVSNIRRVFKWAASQELVPPSLPHGLAFVQGLQRGRCAAKEKRASCSGR